MDHYLVNNSDCCSVFLPEAGGGSWGGRCWEAAWATRCYTPRGLPGPCPHLASCPRAGSSDHLLNSQSLRKLPPCRMLSFLLALPPLPHSPIPAFLPSPDAISIMFLVSIYTGFPVLSPSPSSPFVPQVSKASLLHASSLLPPLQILHVSPFSLLIRTLSLTALHPLLDPSCSWSQWLSVLTHPRPTPPDSGLV